MKRIDRRHRRAGLGGESGFVADTYTDTYALPPCPSRAEIRAGLRCTPAHAEVLTVLVLSRVIPAAILLLFMASGAASDFAVGARLLRARVSCCVPPRRKILRARKSR